MFRFGRHPSSATGAPRTPTSAGELLRLIAGGTLNYGLGQTLPLLLGLLLIPVYTAVLTPEDYGIVEMCAAIGGLLTVFMRFGVPGAVSRFYYDHPEGTGLRDYVTSVSAFLWVNAAGVGALALLLAYYFIDDLIPGLRFWPFVVLAVAATFLSTNAELQRRLVQVRRQSGYSAKLSLVNSLLAITFAIVFVVGFRWGAAGMLLAQALTALLFLVNARMYLRSDLTGRVRFSIVRESVRYGSGIFASHLMSGASPLVSRAALAATASLGAVGLFSLASRVTSPLTMLSNAFSTAYVPEYFSARKDGSEAALRALATAESCIWTLGVQGTLAAAVLGPPMILLLTPPRFHGAAPLVPVLALAFLGQVSYALLSPEVFYLRDRWLPVIVTGTNITVTLGMTFLLVGRYGAFGVAWATVAGSAAGSAACTILAARKAPVPHDWLSLARAALLSVTALGAAWLMPARSEAGALVLGVAVLFVNALALLAAGDPLMRRLFSEAQSRLVRRAEAAKP